MAAKQEDSETIVVDLGNGYQITVTEEELERWAEEHRKLSEELDELFKSTKIDQDDLSGAVTI